jgi:hypothetical protein
MRSTHSCSTVQQQQQQPLRVLLPVLLLGMTMAAVTCSSRRLWRHWTQSHRRNHQHQQQQQTEQPPQLQQQVPVWLGLSALLPLLVCPPESWLLRHWLLWLQLLLLMSPAGSRARATGQHS